MNKLIPFLLPAVLLVWLFLPFQGTVSGRDPPGHLVTTSRREYSLPEAPPRPYQASLLWYR
jgi:hypothetical protein